MGGWQVGTKINLETSLKIGDENGGHNVMGHVDGLAELISIVPRVKALTYVSGSTQYMGFLSQRHVALDGVPDHC